MQRSFPIALFCLALGWHAPGTAEPGAWELRAAHVISHELEQNQVLGEQAHAQAILDFYRDRGYLPTWVTEHGPRPRAFDLLQQVLYAERVGLRSKDYPGDELRRLWGLSSLEERVQLELLLTRTFVRFARHQVVGHYHARDMDPDWHIPPHEAPISSLLREVGSVDSLQTLLRKLLPRHAGYTQLLYQAERYRRLAEEGGWHMVPPGPLLRLGDSDAQIVHVRERLRRTGDLVMGPVTRVHEFDQPLQEAVMRFQARHGLEIDGIVGHETRTAMNVSVHQRLRQIQANLERWRWLPRDLGQRYLMVNLTGFELYAMENDEVVLSMPVIIGKDYRSTPTFSSQVRYLEINPYWTVPKKIVLEDLAPQQMRDPAYLARKGIRVFQGWGEQQREVPASTVPWRKLNENYLPYWLRQDPGPANSLGRIKFMFPNPYDVYLHDTPDRYLFDRYVRTFSSGCIRVQDAIRLAAYLLNETGQSKEEEILSLIYTRQQSRVLLPKPVPIYLVYWTAWVDRDGSMNFRPDVYQRDRTLLARY